MGDQAIPVKNEQYIFVTSLVSQADTKLFQANATLATGDVKVSTDGGNEANISTLPTAINSTALVKVTVSAAEMNGDYIGVLFVDAAGSEWCDQTIAIQTATRGVDDLAYPTTTGRSIDVTATGEVGIDLDNTVGTLQDADVDTLGVDVLSISGDTTAADNAELFFDGTGYNASNSTIGTVTTLTSSSITYAGPVAAATGEVNIISGDDYHNDDSAALSWTSSDWADLTSGTLTCVVEHGSSDGTSFTPTPSIVTSGSGSQTIRIELTDTQTSALSEGSHHFRIRATLSGGNKRTLVDSTWTTAKEIT